MKAQKPAEGISLSKDFGDSKFYRIDCTCGNEEDQIELMIEVDEDIEEIMVSFDTYHATEWWKTLVSWETYKIDNAWLYSIVNSIQSLINGTAHRLAVTRDVWFKGYVKMHTTTYLSKQQALNFAETLKTAINEIEEYHSKKKKK